MFLYVLFLCLLQREIHVSAGSSTVYFTEALYRLTKQDITLLKLNIFSSHAFFGFIFHFIIRGGVVDTEGKARSFS